MVKQLILNVSAWTTVLIGCCFPGASPNSCALYRYQATAFVESLIANHRADFARLHSFFRCLFFVLCRCF